MWLRICPFCKRRSGSGRSSWTLIVNDLRVVGQILHLVPVPARGVVATRTTSDGKVVSLLHKRLRRYGGDRLTADMAAGVERLSGQSWIS